MKHRQADHRHILGEQESQIVAERDRVAGEFERLINLRSEFHAAAAATRDRLRDAWLPVERSSSARPTGLKLSVITPSRPLSSNPRHRSGETRESGCRSACPWRGGMVGIARGSHYARSASRGRADGFGRARSPARKRIRVPGSRNAGSDADRTGATPAERAALAREKAAVSALKESLDEETAESPTASVCSRSNSACWPMRGASGRPRNGTVIEMEEMARDLKQREADLDGRERRLIRADSRRRDEAYDLWHSGSGSKPGRPS